MVILSTNDKVDEAGTSSARGLYDLLRGVSSQVRLGSRSNSRTSNESNTSRATSAVPLATLFPQLSIARVAAAAAASRTSQRASASSDIQASSGVRITEIPTQRAFDPTTFDPTRYTLHEADELFRRNGLRMTTGVMAKILVRYSLILHGFPPCPEEDLMLAVYFYLEETFRIRARMITCYRYQERNHQREAEERVGVLFTNIITAEYVLSRASSVPESGIKVKPNKSDEWIYYALINM